MAMKNFVFVSHRHLNKGEIMDVPKIKYYEDKTWLATELETKSTRKIAKEQRVSYKLINVWALNYGLIKRSEETILA
jgi:hypothetical protein